MNVYLVNVFFMIMLEILVWLANCGQIDRDVLMKWNLTNLDAKRFFFCLINDRMMNKTTTTFKHANTIHVMRASRIGE